MFYASALTAAYLAAPVRASAHVCAADERDSRRCLPVDEDLAVRRALSSDESVASAAPGLGLLQLQSGGGPARGLTAEDPAEVELADLSPEAQRGRLERLKPIIWIHVPKAGSTFLNILASDDQICPDMPEAALLTAESLSGDPMGFSVFEYFLNPEYCNHSTQFIGLTGTHFGVKPIADQLHGHGVMMVRQPEQRIISAYNYGYHSWPHRHFRRPPSSLVEYANVTAGCTVKLLTRDGMSCNDHNPPTDEEVDLALHRLRNDIPFIGLTDQWELSVCLFHAMFGGMCHAVEFNNVRPGERRGEEANRWDTSRLHGWVDEYDHKLFHEAKRIFTRNLKAYNVNEATCPTACRHNEQR